MPPIDELHIAGNSDGLGPIDMARLGRVVAIFGRNGSGKTRLLRRIQRHLQGGGDTAKVVWLGPDRFGIENIVPWSGQSPSALEESVERTSGQRDIHQYGQHWRGALEAFAQSEFAARHPEVAAASPDLHGRYLRRLQFAQKLVDGVMGLKLESTLPAGAFLPALTLGGRPLDAKELSPGQRDLFLFVTALVAQADSLAGAQILLDEPEVHLHAAALASIVQHLRDAVGGAGRLWIASHSLTLLGDLHSHEIWMMKDGRVLSPNSELLAEVMVDLVGSDERVTHLRTVLAEPDAWAAARFATECLGVPSRAEHRAGDPQEEQVAVALTPLHRDLARLDVLDFGAGTGRVAALLAERPLISQHIRYWALEPATGARDPLESAIVTLRRNDPDAAGDAVISELGELERRDPPIRFAAVLLCNVLHEIPATEWGRLFERIRELLRDDGDVVLLEDQELPVGELAHRHGFLVLGEDELRALFGLDAAPERLRPGDSRYGDRLLAVRVPRAALAAVNVDGALESLEQRARVEIRAQRSHMLAAAERDPTAREGRKLALLSQLAVNARLALEDIRAERTATVPP